MNATLSLLGAPTINVDGQARALEFERRSQLLAYLALKRSWVGRAELAALLWPDQESKLAYTNLRKAIYRLQSSPLAPLVEADGAALRCTAYTDVAALEQAIARERSADAVALYRGELLEGFDDPRNEAWASWLAFERDRLRTAWRAAAQRELGGAMQPPAAVELATRLLATDPLDEAALHALVRWLRAAGQESRARQECDQFIARLARELGLEPGAELKALRTSFDRPTSAPSVAAQGAPPVAAGRDGFVGRTVELRRIGELLAQADCRLLCITGPGGMGKTRLAQRAVNELAGVYADGTAFVSLEDLTTGAEFGGRLANELNIAERPRADPLQPVIDALRERHMLLALDNFEQLAAEAGLLDRLLAECPRLKLIVTSRVRLALAGEWLLPLDGLPWPEDEDSEHLESFDAARLFISAARRMRPDFDARGEAPAIIAICRQVEGLPLALEMAATWTRVLSCREIADELERGTELLQSADASRPARHASIERVFDGSWRLLSPIEREALARLSVFRGGFTAEAARAVAGAPLPVLAALIDKSLVRREATRLHLHPLVHQFAHAKLQQSMQTEAGGIRHAQYFLRFLGGCAERVNRADPEALGAMDAEFENIRTSWRLGIQAGWAEELARAAYCLMSYCDHRGHQLQGLQLFEEALASEAVARSSKCVPALAATAAWLAYRLDRYAEAQRLGFTALQVAGSHGRIHEPSIPTYRASTILGATSLRLGKPDEARDWLQRALDSAQKVGTPTNVASALDNLGLIARLRGDLDEALRLYREALLKHREDGDAGGEATCLNNQAVVLILRDELGAAEQVLQQARQLCERHGLASVRAMVEVNLASVTMKLGATERATGHARKALELSLQTGQRAHGIEARHVLVRASIAQGELAMARAELAKAVSAAIAIGRKEFLVHGVRLFAELIAAQGEPGVAAHALAHALEQGTLVGAELADAERHLRAWDPAGQARAPWAGPPIDELVHRIATEAEVSYAPLLAALRPTSRVTSGALS